MEGRRRAHKLSCPQCCVEGDGAEGPDAIVHGLIADGGQEGGEFRGAEEAGNGFWQIGIGGLLSRNKSADFRQYFAKIPAIKITPQAIGRLCEFQDGDSAAGLQHALNLTQAGFVVGEVAKTKGGGDQIKGSVGELKTQGIGFKKRHWRRSGLVRRTRLGGGLLFRPNQHWMGEIRTDASGFPGMRESERKIARSTAESAYKGIGAAEDGLQSFGGARAPEPIQLQ